MCIPENRFTILLFPWLGHGHISPFLELAKKLSNAKKQNKKKHFDIYLCSTPANLESIKKTLPEYITLINLNLPTLPDLPPNLHTTNGLPLHLMPILKQAFDDARPQFTEILKMLRPDLLIYDTIQCWAPLVAASFGIPSVVFIATSATMAATMFHLYLNHSKGVAFPFSKIFFRAYEHKNVSEILESSANGLKDKDRVMGCVFDSTSIVLVKSFREIEGKYADYLSQLTRKRIVPVGPLVADPKSTKQNSDSVIEWLDTKAVGSTVFVSFGSEYYLSKADLEEIAHGLEMSNVNFIWVLRFPKNETQINVSEALPKGFVERVKDRGLLINGWAPQTKILGHKNVGGFVSHCGWNSVMEAMKFGVPIIAMPMHLDQPVNARLVAEVGVGVEVLRDGNGLLKWENLAKVVQRVVVSEAGEIVRQNAKKMSVDLKAKGENEIDVVVDELLGLCKVGARLRGIESIGIKRAKSEAFALNMWCTVEGGL